MPTTTIATAISATPVDLVLYAKFVVPVVPTNVVLRDHAVVVRGSRIVAVLPHAEARATFADAGEHRELGAHILIPGLINAHSHAAMNLLRGLSDDKPLCDWLAEDVWPAEAQFVTPAFVRDGVTHAAAEMIRGGTTCCNDMYFFPEDACQALQEIGLRGVVGQVVMQFPTGYASGPEDYLAKARAMLTKYAPTKQSEHEQAHKEQQEEQRLIHMSVAPHAPFTVGEDTLCAAQALAGEFDVPLHMHVHEAQPECDASEMLDKNSMNCHLSDHKLRPLANLARMKLLSSRFIAVHMTQLREDEIDIVAHSGAHVVHCPSSNLKLASGIARTTELLARDVNVALGTDGACSNNALDMLAEMKLAAILAKAQSMESTSVPAAQALQMATLNGARALGLDSELGSIEVGKRADLVAIACDSIEMLPMYDPISHVVYVAGRENVSDVWINGKHVLAERQLTTVSEDEVKTRVRQWNDRVRDYHNELVRKKMADASA